MVEKWLRKTIYGYSSLSPVELKTIMHFTMLWSFFENYVFSTSVNASAISKKMTDWASRCKFPIGMFELDIQYFRNRYISKGSVNTKFMNLRFRGNDNLELVKDVLLGSNEKESSIATALLIIVLRIRNNLFHGLKWEYGIRNQLRNFEVANRILIKIIELE